MYGQSNYSKILYSDFNPTESEIKASAPDQNCTWNNVNNKRTFK